MKKNPKALQNSDHMLSQQIPTSVLEDWSHMHKAASLTSDGAVPIPRDLSTQSEHFDDQGNKRKLRGLDNQPQIDS